MDYYSIDSDSHPPWRPNPSLSVKPHHPAAKPHKYNNIIQNNLQDCNKTELSIPYAFHCVFSPLSLVAVVSVSISKAQWIECTENGSFLRVV